MRIGYVLKEFPKISETFIAREILELERLGFEITVLALRRPREEVPHAWLDTLRAEVVYCEPRTSFSLAWKELKGKALREPSRKDGIGAAVAAAFDCPFRSGRSYLVEAMRAAQVAEERGLRHLHAHFANHPTFVTMLAHLVGGAPFSFTAHAKDIFVAPPTPDLWRTLLAEAAFAVTVSDANREHIENIVGSAPAGKLRRLYNGVDLRQIRPRVEADARMPRVLFVGRLIEKKGADLVVDAAARLRDLGLEIGWTIIGAGELEGTLRDRVSALGLQSIVRLTSALSHEDVVAELQRADVLALPCRVASNGDRDALPTVLLEALAAGVPAVSTAVNGIPEIITHGRNGLLVPENDASSLAQAVGTLVTEPLLRRRMSLAARRRAEALFDARKNVAQLAEWIERSSGAGGRSQVAMAASRAFGSSARTVAR